MPLKYVILLAGLLLFSPSMAQIADGVDIRDYMERQNLTNKRKNLIKRSDGTRIDRSKVGKCKDCPDRNQQMKSMYLERTLDVGLSKDYQKLIEAKIFADQKFRAKCWNKVATKDIDFFFTVSTSGRAEEFAWFPNKSVAKCIQRHIASIEFPIPERRHHSWLLVTDIIDIESSKLVGKTSD